MQEAFKALGFTAPIVTDHMEINDWAVVLGANLLPSQSIPLPRRLIVYNLEQIFDGSPWMTTQYIELLKRYPVWDYSARNIERLKVHGITRVALCGIGYMPTLSRISPTTEDIDVLFVGLMNDRRYAVLNEISKHAKNVMVGSKIYGESRDKMIAAAKVVLNVHYYEGNVFEIVRVSYLLANRKCVVSETGDEEALEAPLRDGIAFCSYADLSGTCLRLLEQPQERARLAAIGFERLRALSQVPMLQRALSVLPPES